MDYKDFTLKNNYFEVKRMQQTEQIMIDYINNSLHDHFYNNKDIRGMLNEAETMLINKSHSPYQAAHILLEKYFNQLRQK